MDEGSFWKQTKKATEGWGTPPSPSSSPLITPVFAHASQEAVRIRKNPLFWFDDPDNLNEYHYLVTLIKKRQKYKAALRVYIANKDGNELPLSIDRKLFGLDDLKRIGQFLGIPNGIFQLKNKHKQVITYKGVKMAESKFNEEIEKWRGKQT